MRGKVVKVIKNAPLQDPVEYEIMGYRIALRRSEAELIGVSPMQPDDLPEQATTAPETLNHETINRFLHQAGRLIHVALVGNPNCGKTSLFNIASGSHERVGNYSGVTVDAKASTFQHDGYTIRLVDLPGTYSITEYTPEELYVRTHILDELPDVVINVVDAANLERNLFLTTQLIDMNLKVLIALNMYDELEQTGARLDSQSLGEMIGIPIVPTVASRGEGIGALFDKVIAVFEDNEPVVRHIHINYGHDLEQSINVLQNLIWENKDIVARYSSRYLAIKLLEGDTPTKTLLQPGGNYDQVIAAAARETGRLEKRFGHPVESVIADAKYGFISGALSETLQVATNDKHQRTSRIDGLVTHRLWGIPIFLLLMWVMFQATFTLGAIPAGWIEWIVGTLGEWVMQTFAPGPLRALIVDGIISGVGGVIVFLPNILILFFFISLMEDTGYMARAAFIMDKLMHKMGLHGKSFIPLLMGFGCNVPAIMATRTLESRKNRVLTMLIIPFMSCSARLPVYVLLISAFFPSNKGLVLFSIYIFGVMVAVASSLLFKRIFFTHQEAPFVMELPPYRVPTSRSVLIHMWSKGAQYLQKMGTVILLASIIIWALGHYPDHSDTLSPSAQQEQSYIGHIGRAVEPVLSPLGFDWQMSVSILTGLAAKEVVVSTMAVLAGVDNEPAEEVEIMDTQADHSLISSLQKQRHAYGVHAGELVYTPLVAYTFMIFILLYFPCVAAITAIRKEAGWKWALFTLFYTTGMAWVLSFVVYRVGGWLL